jgi:hypothetical protein
LSCVLIAAAFLVSFPGCSGFDSFREFQQNDSFDYKMFDILDDYPSLYSLVESLDQYVVNDILGVAVGERTDEYIANTNARNAVLSDSRRPVQKSLQKYRDILERIINQDHVVEERMKPSNHAAQLYSLIDLVRDADLGLEHDIVTLLRTKNNYMLDTYDAAYLSKLTDNEIEDMDDPATAASILLEQKTDAKTSLLGDYNIWLDSGGNVCATFEDSVEDGVTDTGLGNLVRARMANFIALNRIIRDDTLKNTVFDLIREYGKLATSEIGGTGKKMPDIIKEMLLNTESYFTIGGSKYESVADSLGGVTFKVYGGSTDVNHADNQHVFSNAEMRQLSLSSNPSSWQMFIRSDRPQGSMIDSVDPTLKVTDGNYENKANRNYFLEKLLLNLRNIGFNPENEHLEESIYDLIRFDLHGRDRKEDSSAWSVAFLESLLFLSGAAQNSGWTDGGNTSERGDTMSNGDPEALDTHGHGSSTEVLSMNDALFSMGVQTTVALGCIPASIYDSAFGSKSRTYRSRNSFTFADKDGYRFQYDQNYPLQSFMSGMCAGEMGLPGGGNPNGSAPGNNGYRPYTADSIGDRNMARWTYYNVIRACWHGEGPYYYAPADAPTVTADLDGTGSKTWHVYYRPNGLIYAYVHKANPSDPSSWTYLAPADGHDAEDSGTSVVGDGRGRRQRTNRFRHSWYSDYYLAQLEIFDFWDLNPFDGDVAVLRHSYIAPRNDGVNNSTAEGDSVDPGRFVFHEILQPEDNDTRECASLIEAIYRNFVWCMNEKKYGVVIPMSLYATLDISGAGFKIVESNGTLGLTSARRYFDDSSRNHVWIRQGTNGGISTIPGDYRQSIYWRKGWDGLGLVPLDLDKAWTSTLWGTSSPPVVAHNAPAITRFAFPRFSKTLNVTHGGSSQDVNFTVAMGSGPRWFQASESDPNWNRRNGLLPVFVALLSTIWDYQDRNFTDSSNREESLRRFQRFAQNLVTMITPRFYYIRNGSNAADFMHGTWIPRIRGNGDTSGMPHAKKMHYNSWEIAGSAGHHVDGIGEIRSHQDWWFGGMAQRSFYQPEAMRTLINRLYDSDISDGASPDNRCDGMLALITEYDVDAPRRSSNETNTRVVTKVFNILMRLADPAFDDPPGIDYAANDYDETWETWGARRQILYALEQSATGVKSTEGHIARLIREKPPWGIHYPSWVYVTGTAKDGNGEWTSYTGGRDCDLVLDEGLRLSVGWDDKSDDPDNDPNVGLGLAAIDEWDADDWEIFTKKMDMAAELSSDNGVTGGKYNVTELTIEVINQFLEKINPTNEQIKALVHTKGIINAYHDGSTWQYPDDLRLLGTEYAKAKLEIGYGTEYTGSVFTRELLIGGGLFEYILTTMDCDYSSEEIITDLYRFLGDPLISDENSQFWTDVVDMSAGQIELLEQSRLTEEFQHMENRGFQYNGPMTNPYDIDYYGDIGRVFTR